MLSYSELVRDRQGAIVDASLTPDQKWRLYARPEEISPLLSKTIISKEDRHFYNHPGVNILAVCRALSGNIFGIGKKSGASTITMQVARQLEHRPRTVGSKIIESFRAFQLEWKYSKAEILQLYFNTIPFGGNIEGVKAASLLYFQKDPDHLSLAEITALSVIPNNPSRLRIGVDNESIIKKRNVWLARFKDAGLFTSNEITQALSEPLSASRKNFPHEIPHLSRKRPRQHETSTFIDMNMQWKVEQLVQDYVKGLRLQDIRNAAVMVIDNNTHQVVTYVGSSSFQDATDGGQVNGAAAIRQPGSTLKPLLYARAMDRGLATPRTILMDVPTQYGNYAPENYDLKFNGAVSLETALEHSLNIPAVRVLNQLGTDDFVELLSKAGFKQIAKDRKKLGLSVILGGCGATLEELTAVYSAFACKGVMTAPYFFKGDKKHEPVRLFSDASSYMINMALSEVSRPDFPLSWSATAHMPRIAWKTGTSYGRRDGWSIGYNQRYTVGVWTGNFSAQGAAGLSGATIATPLLFRIFNTIDYDSRDGWFQQPESCASRLVCQKTGLAPGANCTELVTDLFIPMVSDTRECGHMKEVKLTADGKYSYCAACAPATGYRKQLFSVMDPELESFNRSNGIKLASIPPHNPDCDRGFSGQGPRIVSPSAGGEYYLDIDDPQPIPLQARSGTDVHKLYWYIDDEFFKSVSPGETLSFMPQEGPVRITCGDDKGRKYTIRIEVKAVRL